MDPVNILGTITYQLLSFLPANALAMSTLDDKHDLLATVSNLKVLLDIVLEGLGRSYIVIDALDECPAVALQHLLPFLFSLSRKASILVTTRPNAPLIQRAFEGRVQPIVVTARDVNPDIELYIRQCIVTVDDEADPNRDFGAVVEVREPSLRKEIVDTLIKNAEGMFLWVRLQVQHLAEQHTDHDIRMSLQELPRSLDATYIRSLDHIYHLDDKRRKRVQGVFRWLICAGFQGLNVELVCHAIAADEMLDHWDSSMVVTNHNGLISDCANLVEFTPTPHSKDRDSKTVPTIQFIHTSVKDFLVNSSSGNSDGLQSSPHLSRFFVFPSLSFAHHIVFQSCFKSLCLLERGTEGADPCPELSRYVRSPSLLSHLCNADEKNNSELGSLTQSFLTLLSMRTSPIQSMLQQNSDAVDTGYHMALHLAAGLSCSNIMSYLVTYGGPIQPPYGGFSVTKRDKFGRTPLHYAAGCPLKCSPVADSKAYDCIQLLLEANADTNAVDERGRTALHYIARQGATGNRFMPDQSRPESPIELLLRKGANPNICDVQGDTPLHCASRCYWVDKHALQILLANHGDPNIPNMNRATCLHVLMMNEMPDNKALKILLDGGAGPGALDAHDKTPLHILVGQSRFFNNLVQTVKELLQSRPGLKTMHGCPALNVNARDKDGMTPLHILGRATGPLCNRKEFVPESASVAHDILELLLRYGADVRVQDLKGCTPYQLIVKNDRIAPRTSHLVVAASSQGKRNLITVDTSTKVLFRPCVSTPLAWEGEEQSESRYVRTWSAPAFG